MGGEGEIKDWFQKNGYGNVKKGGGSFGGSGWSSTARWSNDDKSFFVKTSSRSVEKMFAGEAAGLRAMRTAAEAGGGDTSEILKIPQVFACENYQDGHGSFIIMEFLSLSGRPDAKSFGRAMARMHLADTGQSQFGFHVDNTCGATPQPNTFTANWPEFWVKYRLEHQANLAGDPAISRLVDQCADRIHHFFSDEESIVPSCLHGDLWSGNINSVVNGDGQISPTIFDPACYYGHHEAEWGMSWCASLGPQFWAGYRELIPEAPLFRARRPLYEAYHQMNHYNLFGGGYRGAAVSCLEQALQAIS